MSLKVWLPLNGNLSNQGISNITITNSGATVDTAGKIGSCYAFNGSSKMTAANVSISASPISACCWVYLNNNITNLQYLISLNASTGFADHQIGLAIQDSKYYFVVGGNSNAAVGTPVLNTWVHMAVTFDGSTIKGYINGAQVTSVASTATLSKTNFTIGARNNGGTDYAYFLKGKLNDIRIYDHCLSAAEVREISQGLVLHYKLDEINDNYSKNNNTAWTNINIGQYYTIIFSYTMADFLAATGAKNGDKFTWSLDIKTTSGTKHIAARVQHYNSGSNRNSVVGNQIGPNSEGRSSVVFTINTNYNQLDFMINNIDSSTVTANSTEQYRCTRIQAGDVHTNWLPTNISKIIEDSSGYNHNGTIIGTLTLSSDTPRYSASMVFDGTASCIACGRGAMVKDAITVSIWANKDTWNTTGIRPVSCTEGGGWNFEASGDYIQFPMGTGASSNAYKVAKSTVKWTDLTAGWHMFTGTYDGLSVKLYIDGVLDTTNNAYTTKTPIFYHNSNGVFLAAEAGGTTTTPGGTYFPGKLSDFRIYCTALSADDIKSLYQLGAKIDNQKQTHTREFIEQSNGAEFDTNTTPYYTLIKASDFTSSTSTGTYFSYPVKGSTTGSTTTRTYSATIYQTTSSHLDLSQSNVYIISWNTVLGTSTRVGSYSTGYWTGSGNNRRWTSRTCYYNIGHIYVYLKCYDASDNLIKQIVLDSQGRKLTGSTTSQTSSSITINPNTVEIEADEGELGAYSIIQIITYGTRDAFNSGTFKVIKRTPPNYVNVQLKKTGSFIIRNIEENEQFYSINLEKHGRLISSEALEI